MSKTSVARRTFLRGVGASLGLPFLDAMRASAAPKENRPVRLAFVFFPNGAIMPSWTPQQMGAGYKLSKTLAPIADVKDDILVLSGLAQDNGRAKGDGPGDHARCAASFLTGAHPVKTAGANIRVGVSADQLAAQHIGGRTKLRSLELGTERGRNAGGCDSGYSCAYSSNIAWSSPTTPVAKEINPRLAYERLFGSAKGGEQLAKRNLLRRSILDVVADDARKLRGRLGRADQRKLEEYFSSVREVERRIALAEKEAKQRRPSVKLPDRVPSDFEEHARLMYEMMLLAFQTDSTRVASFMLGNAGSNRTYSMVGARGGHHQLSHHQNDQSKVTSIQKIDQLLVGQFADFVARLRSTPDGDGSLLDNSLIVYGSGLGDGNRHRHDDLPILLAGRGGGSVRPGRHIRYDQEVPLNNLFLSMLDRAGAKVDSFGDSTGRLRELS